MNPPKPSALPAIADAETSWAPPLAGDRRASKRFDIELGVTYNVLNRRLIRPTMGSGYTVNISSRGVLFQAQGPALRAGQRLEISVTWPALLRGRCPLRLVARGRVQRVEDGRVAMTILRYDFHTRRTKDWPTAPQY